MNKQLLFHGKLMGDQLVAAVSTFTALRRLTVCTLCVSTVNISRQTSFSCYLANRYVWFREDGV